MSLKQCSPTAVNGCGEWRSRADFYRNPQTADGLFSICKPCCKRKAQTWESAQWAHRKAYRARRRQADPDAYKAAEARKMARHRAKKRDKLQAIKLAAGCTDCGLTGPAEALEFDHLPELGVKLFNLSSACLGKTWEQIEVEIAKCEVVCANCHRVRTAARRHAVK
jgi:hypothetical protein